MGVFLHGQWQSKAAELRAIQIQNAKNATLAKLNQAALQDEKQKLEQRVGAIHKFLKSRIVWSSFTRDIAARLPNTIALTSFQGVAELKQTGPKHRAQSKVKKSLIIRAATRISEDGATPPAIGEFLSSLRADPLLKKDLPIIELSGLKQSPSGAKKVPTAEFTIICSPKNPKRAK